MKRTLFSFLLTALAASLDAQTYGARVSDSWTDIKPVQWSCGGGLYGSSRLYEPNVYALYTPNSNTPNGELGMMSQGACPPCAFGNYGDALMYNHRTVSGVWDTPAN